MANGPLIQTSDLDATFRALRARDIEGQTVPYHPDYPSVPDQNYPGSGTVHTGSWGNGMSRFASTNTGIVYG